MLTIASRDVASISRLVRRKKTEQNVSVRFDKCEADVTNNKCIGDDTKAAARQSPNCIRKQK